MRRAVAGTIAAVFALVPALASAQSRASRRFDTRAVPRKPARSPRPTAAAGPTKPAQALRVARRATDDTAAALSRARTVRGRDHGGMVAFTFDDGPDAVRTPRILADLDRYDVPGAFFVVGRRFSGDTATARAAAQVLRDIRDRGHLIGNHTFSHVRLSDVSTARAMADIDRNDKALREHLGRDVYLFRPPYAVMTKAVGRRLAKKRYTVVRWSIDTEDFRTRAAGKLRKSTVAAILDHGGGVVLLHDTKPWTARAVAGILDDLEAENCRRLAAGDADKPPIWPVSLHYFLRDGSGGPRTVPKVVAERTRAYQNALPERCRSRIDKDRTSH